MKSFFWFGWAIIYLFSSSAFAAKVDYSGFATVSGTYVDNDQLSPKTNFLNNQHGDFTLKNGSNFGFQANLHLSSKWDAVGQIVLQDRIKRNLDDFVELAFIRYRPDRHWSFRVGRINSDLYLLSEYQYVGYAYLWSRPPNEYYSVASFASNFDGLDIEYKNNIGDGFLKLRASYGATDSELENNDERFAFSLKNITTLSASYQLDSWLVRASHSQSNYANIKSAELDHSLTLFRQIPEAIWPSQTQISDGFDISGKSSSYSSLGLSYEGYRWLFHSELGYSKGDWLPFTSSITGYATLGYIQDDMTYFMSVSAIKNRNKFVTYEPPILDPNYPAEFNAYITAVDDILTNTLNGVASRQATLSVGLKYDFAPDLNIKLQADHTNISPKGYGLWYSSNSNHLTSRHKVNTLTASLNVLF